MPQLDAAEEENQLSEVMVGSYITFGSYEQDNDLSNGKEDIEWLILDYDAENNRALLLSKYGLVAKPYNRTDTNVTWEDCTLRKWLNGEFLNDAFNAEERSAIQMTSVDNSSSQGYSKWSTNGGNNTQDQVFLLSYAEANRYLSVTRSDFDNMDSRVAPTAYAVKSGATLSSSYTTNDGSAAGWWWLRSPGDFQRNAACVLNFGSLDSYYVYDESGCVRPALWVNLEFLSQELILRVFSEPGPTPEAISTSMPTSTATVESRDVDEGKNQISEAEVGSYVTFGSYEQDNDLSNGKEDIEWLVLDRDDEKALIISKYVLDWRPYNDTSTDVTWETCSLRKWLNETFISSAFSTEEQSSILSSTVTADQNPTYKSSAGNTTIDKIFLLSTLDVDKYFSSSKGRDCKGTTYCNEQESYKDGVYGYCMWWLRTPGRNVNSATFVYSGYGYSYALAVDKKFGVRPALWVSFDSVNQETSSKPTTVPETTSEQTQTSSLTPTSTPTEMPRPTQTFTPQLKDVAKVENQLFEAKVGSYVTFGSYEQDNDSSNGKEDIEWLILDYDAVNNRLFLLSRYGLDTKPYNISSTKVTWETCTLLNWLNGEFLNDAFSAVEQSVIHTTLVDNSASQGNRKWSTYGGSKTRDQIFLLSYAEVNKYLSVASSISKNTKLRVAPTAYAINEGAYKSSENKTTDDSAAGWWWLRSPGDSQDNAASISIGGSLYSYDVRYDSGCVRPALWVDLDSLNQDEMPLQNGLDANTIQHPEGKCIANKVNIREKPEMNGRSVGILNRGDTLKILYVDGEWCKIQAGEVIGYIKAQYIDFGEEKRDSSEVESEEVELESAETENGSVKVGSYVFFGSYEQDNNLSNGTEDIEWLVLDYDAANNQLLLLSRYGLDMKPYDNASLFNRGIWETCTLRSWLNEEFLDVAFSQEEKSVILMTSVDNSSSQGYNEWKDLWRTSVWNGNSTQDRVFLLSYAEANKYLNVTYEDHDNTKSRAVPTAYAIQKGAITYSGTGKWWLRSSGSLDGYAAEVKYDGSLYDSRVTIETNCVRPALWVKFDSSNLNTTIRLAAVPKITSEELPMSLPTPTPLLTPTLMPLPTSTPEPDQLQQKTLSGKGTGFGGDIVVTLSIEDGVITDCAIEAENEVLGGTAIDELAAQVVTKNGADIDGVSGATLTSNGVRDAVKDALGKDK